MAVIVILAASTSRCYELASPRGQSANIQNRTECIPPDGVYATRLILPDGAYPSITNIGMRPTFAEPERTFEAHIFDFDRDIKQGREALTHEELAQFTTHEHGDRNRFLRCPSSASRA